MARKKKAKDNTKTKRKKSPVKAATRRKTTTVRKKPTKKAEVRRASPKVGHAREHDVVYSAAVYRQKSSRARVSPLSCPTNGGRFRA